METRDPDILAYLIHAGKDDPLQQAFQIMIAVQPFFPAAAREQMIQRMTDTLPVCLRKRCALTVIEPQHSLAKQLLQLFQQLIDQAARRGIARSAARVEK